MEKYTLALFERGTEIAAKRGLILVDTKYEFGLHNGEVTLMDEIHTPDSSRYFYSEGYEEKFEKGEPQKQLSKEFVREWLLSNNFQGQEGQKLPEMTDEIVENISNRYIELYENITGEKIQQRGSRRPRKAHREKRARIFGINFPDEIIKTASPCKRVRLFLYQLLNNKTELRNFISDMLFCPLRMRTKTIAISLTKKHMACCKKYKALILKYVPYISKIYALYFSPFQTPETQQLTKAPKSASKTPPATR